MTIDISGIAFAIRSDSAQSPHPIKLSHAQQCVAAALGYKSLAALQASGDDGLPLDRDCHIVLDANALTQRGRELGLLLEEKNLLALVATAFGKKLQGIGIHMSLGAFDDALRVATQNDVLNDVTVAGEIAVTNNDGIDEIYLPFSVDWDAIPDNGDPLEVSFAGHVSVGIDNERPYWGHRIDVEASLWVSRPGRAVWAASCKVASAKLDRGHGEERPDDEPRHVSLTEALAEELGLSFDEADELVDAQLDELASDDGLVYGYAFDFSDLELDPKLRRKLERKNGSLRLQVMPHFLERVHGRDAQARRHCVHGDQHEADPTKYFCASCDLLVEADHFEAQHPGATEERYFAALRAWTRRPARNKIKVRRPANAFNVLAEVAVAQRAAREASRSGFHRWLELQVGRRDRVGDLARDVKGDRKFPIAESSPDRLQQYLELSGAIPEAIRTFKRAWKEFLAGT